MLIVSKFRDYYDSIKAYGIDKSVVYNRVYEKQDRTVYLEKLTKELGNAVKSGAYRNSYEIHTGVVGFCGQVYPYVRIYKWGMEAKIDVYYFDKEQARAAIKNALSNEKRSRYYYGRDVTDDLTLNKHFDSTTWNALGHIFQDFKVPVFQFSCNKHYGYGLTLHLNPELKPLGFMRVKNPPQAFQELYQYISGVLGATKEVPIKMSDIVMQHSKGFDHPYSFRKEPTKRKGKKK